MALRPVRSIAINLNRKPNHHLDSVAYSWAINVGRMLILITELVALGALFYRFVIDKQIIDLHDRINTEKNLVTAEQSLEQQFRGIQDRLAIVKAVQAQTDSKMKVMNDILSASQNGMFSSAHLSINNNQITVDGITDQLSYIYTVVNKVKQYPEVTSINITQINSTDQGVIFQLEVNLKDNPTIHPEDQ